ncbi:unnamed protein product [Microthlaspi erraticum]|uniref:Uncharacterized protein n=1 Tax=Microthlaspi erraticum TaxID=1685480 RepID=A0A6D2L112_9BRAS|nr:unnamed protein product [Microthlaspi erraticum]
MAVVESGVGGAVAAAADAGVVIQPPSSPTSQDSGVSSDDQNHHSSSRIELGGQILRHDQGGLYSKIGSHVARSDGADGGESYKRDMRELQELFSKLNPMAEEFVPPSLTKQGGNGGINGANGGFFTSAGSFFRNGNANGGFFTSAAPLATVTKTAVSDGRRALVKGNGG